VTRRYLVRMLVTELREYVLEADSRADAREKAESLDTGTDYVNLDTTDWSVEHVESDD